MFIRLCVFRVLRIWSDDVVVSFCADSHGFYILHRKGNFLCDLYFGCLAEVSLFLLLGFSSCFVGYFIVNLPW